jgi:predicted DNA-binding transcriptional regulator AlpA
MRALKVHQPKRPDPASPADGGPPPAAARKRDGRALRRRLLRAEKASRLCDVSLATWWRWDSAGKIPAGLKITGGSKRWRLEELEAWIRAGCPDRATWNAMNGR